MKIQYKIWLEKDGKVIFGKGREEMFRAILEYKSLLAAAKELKMSYKRARTTSSAAESGIVYRKTWYHNQSQSPYSIDDSLFCGLFCKCRCRVRNGPASLFLSSANVCLILF